MRWPSVGDPTLRPSWPTPEMSGAGDALVPDSVVLRGAEPGHAPSDTVRSAGTIATATDAFRTVNRRKHAEESWANFSGALL
jgi:hypothetical protein